VAVIKSGPLSSPQTECGPDLQSPSPPPEVGAAISAVNCGPSGQAIAITFVLGCCAQTTRRLGQHASSLSLPDPFRCQRTQMAIIRADSATSIRNFSSAFILASPDVQQDRNDDHAKDCPSQNANLCRGHRAVPWSRWPNTSRLKLVRTRGGSRIVS
jgi:hypothetical protein